MKRKGEGAKSNRDNMFDSVHVMPSFSTRLCQQQIRRTRTTMCCRILMATVYHEQLISFQRPLSVAVTIAAAVHPITVSLCLRRANPKKGRGLPNFGKLSLFSYPIRSEPKPVRCPRPP